MTYKGMVKHIVEREACKWLRTFVRNEHTFISADNVDIKIEDGTFKCQVTVYVTGIIPTPRYVVGGTVDEYGYVYCSIITDMYTKKMVWAWTEELRKTYNITEFTI